VKQQQIASTSAKLRLASAASETDDAMAAGSRRNPRTAGHLTVATAKGERVSDAAVEVLGKYYAPTFEKLGVKRSEQLLTSLTELHDLLCTSRTWTLTSALIIFHHQNTSISAVICIMNSRAEFSSTLDFIG